MALLLDTHYHFDFLQGVELRAAFVRELASLGSTSTGPSPASDVAGPATAPGVAAPAVRVVAQTIKPSEYVELMEQVPTIAELAGVGVDDPGMPLWSLGFHPWQIESEEQAERELAIFEECMARCSSDGRCVAGQHMADGGRRFIGEIGLDFAPSRLEQASADLQERVLRRILKAVCTEAGRKTDKGAEAGAPFVLSIHAVRASTAVLDLLEELRVTKHNVAPIIHWFSGTSDELTRLIRLGGYVSINPRMLESKRGRAYVKQVPSDQLLLETDLPAGAVPADSAATTTDTATTQPVESIALHSVRELRETLDATLTTISEIRGEDAHPELEKLQRSLFGVC